MKELQIPFSYASNDICKIQKKKRKHRGNNELLERFHPYGVENHEKYHLSN